jgi:preprotein translocase subunit SecB
MSSGGTDFPGGMDNGPAAGSEPMPNLQVVAQYIKDLSFENPGAPANLTSRPQIDFGVDLQARRGDGEHFEVEMKIRVDAKAGDKPLFLLELVYAGLFRLTNIPAEALQQVLLIQAPFVLFPFARRIVADVVRDGGMPPLMIEPIDFVALYQAKMAQGQNNTGMPAGTA